MDNFEYENPDVYEQYQLEFRLKLPGANSETFVSKKFDNYMESEFATLINELKYCLIACGYSQNLVDEFIPEIE
jgi:hypothetical protein